MTKEEFQAKKKWLWQYQKSLNVERQLRRQIAAERERVTATTKALSPVVVAGSGENKIESAVCRIVERQEALREQIQKVEAIRQEVEAAIDAVDGADVRNVLRERYIIGTAYWWQVANNLHMSERWAKKLHRIGVEKVCTPVHF